MPHKHLLVRSAAREKILHGARALVDAMRVTIGPESKCVLIEKKWVAPSRLRRRRDLLAEELGIKLANLTLDDLGRAK